MEGSIRSCLVEQRKDFAGYGFNLHAEKGKLGQYVGKVDSGSPAEDGGLRESDRIVEVNGVNIGEENHQQVVTRIKSQGNHVTLLVVDKVADNYCRAHNITINSSLECVDTVGAADIPADVPEDVELTTDTAEDVELTADTAEDVELTADTAETTEIPAPDNHDQSDLSAENESDVEEDLPPPPPEMIAELEEEPVANGLNEDEEVDAIVQNGVENSDPIESSSGLIIPPPRVETPPSSQRTPSPREPTPPPREATPSPPPPIVETPPRQATPPPREETPPPQEATPIREPSPPPREPTPPPPETTPAPVQASSDPLPKVSAKEMREMLKNKKKTDPRKANLSAKAKLDMFQRL